MGSLSNITIASGHAGGDNSGISAQAVSDKIEGVIDGILGGVSDSLAEDMQPVIDALQKAQAAAGAAKAAASLIPSSVTAVPKSSAGSAMSNALTSVKQKLQIEWLELKKEWHKLKEGMRNVSAPSLDTLMDTAAGIVKETIVQAVDTNVRRETGYTPIETYYACQDGINMLKRWKACKEKEEGADGGKAPMTNPSTNMSVQAPDAEGAKSSLKAWLDLQPDALYNAFFLIELRDIVSPLADMLEQKMNLPVEELLFSVQGINDMMGLLDEFDITSATLAASGSLNAYTSGLKTLEASNAATCSEFTLQIEDGASGRLKLLVSADPSKQKSKLQKVLKAGNLFTNVTVQSIITDVQDAYSSGIGTASTYKGKDGLTYEIEVVISTIEDASALVEATVEVAAVYEDSTSDTSNKKVLPILKAVINAIKSLLPALAAIAALLDNWKANKGWLKADALKNSDMFKQRTLESMGYEVIEDVSGKNVYAVRTAKCKALLEGILQRDVNGDLTLTTEETDAFKAALDREAIDSSEVEAGRETKVLVQVDGGEDGDLGGLSTIVLGHLGKLMSAKNGRDPLPSQLMRGNRDGGCNAWDADDGSDDASASIPEVVTDEIDGEQMFNVDALIPLCDIGDDIEDPDWGTILSKMDSISEAGTSSTSEAETSKRCIIEFADDCIMYDGEPYGWCVGPGASVSSSTCIAKCVQDYVWKDAHSIFTKGTVEEVSVDGSKGYARAYQSCGADRHIILKDVQYGSDVNIDTSVLEEMSTKFSEESVLSILIICNMPYSVLPQILMRRYETYYWEAAGIKHYYDRPDGLEIYAGWKSHVDETIENFMKSEDVSVGAAKIKGTDGDTSLLDEIAQRAIEAKEKFMTGQHSWNAAEWGIIDLYKNYVGTLDKCEGDNESFSDCKKLGVSYYLDLISRVQTLSDDDWDTEYYELLSDIITRRNNYERVSIEDVKEYVNAFARGLFDGYEYKDGVVKHLDGAFPDGGASTSDIYNWLVEHAIDSEDDETELAQLANLYAYYADNKTKYTAVAASSSVADIPITEVTVTDDGEVYWQEDPSARGSSLTDANADIYDYVGSSATDSYDIYKLTCIEAKRLSEFWDKAITAYTTQYDLGKCIDELNSFTGSFDSYAEWPPKSEIEIDGEKFDYFFFDNYDWWKHESSKDKEDPTDGTASDADGVEAPVAPTEVDLPSEGDAEESFDDKEPDSIEKPEVQITDTKYWRKYFSLATILSLLPAYWAPGLVLPPLGTVIPLPVICTAIKAIHIKALDLLLVVGLAVRGVSINPVFLYVNLSSQDLSLLFPLTIALKQVKATFDANIEELEDIVPSICDTLAKKLEQENERLKKANMEIDIQLEELKSMSWPGLEQEKVKFKDAALGVGTRLKIIRGEDILNSQK